MKYTVNIAMMVCGVVDVDTDECSLNVISSGVYPFSATHAVLTEKELEVTKQERQDCAKLAQLKLLRLAHDKWETEVEKIAEFVEPGKFKPPAGAN